MNIAKNKIFVPESSGSINSRSLVLANALFVELANYGLELDAKAHARLIKLSPQLAMKYTKNILAHYTLGKLNPPLFKNWESRTVFTFNERVVQIFGYIFQFCGNDFDNESFMQDLKSKIDFAKAVKIELVTDQEFQEYFEKLVGSNLALDKNTSNKLLDIFSYFTENFELIPRIKSPEIRIAAILALSKDYSLDSLLVGLKCNSLDVLRFAAAKNDFQQFKLPSDVKFANLSWATRIALFTFLNKKAENDFESISEDMGLNRTAWARFFKHTHFFGQTNFVNRFFRLYFAAFVSLGSKYESAKNDNLVSEIDSYIKDEVIEITDGGNLAYRTFASRIQSAINAKNWPKIKKLCAKKDNYLLRNISSILNAVSDKHEADFFKTIETSIKKADIGVLFSLLSIDTDASYRIIDVKGKTIIETAQYPKLFNKLQVWIEMFIQETYGFEGQVKVSPELKNRIVPFLSKNTNLERGSKYDLSDDDYLYFYVHWIEKSHRADIDLSFIFVMEDGRSQVMDFRHNVLPYAAHSGDFTSASAPHGATEYGKIKLKNLPKNVKFIAPTLNMYNGDPFNELKEVRAGFYSSSNPEFSLQQESIKYNLTQPAMMNCPFIYNVDKKQVVTLDYNREEKLSYTVDSYITDIKKIIEVSQKDSFVSIEKLANILSGDKKTISLKITDKPSGAKEINPEQLFSIFTK